MLDYRRRRFVAAADGDGDEYEDRTSHYIRLMNEVFDAQREELMALRNSGDISRRRGGGWSATWISRNPG